MDYTSLSNITNTTGNLFNDTLWPAVSVTPKVAVTYHCDSVVKFTTYSLVAGVLCLLGFVGNSVSFIVLRMDEDSRVAGFLLQTLAFTDNLFLATWFLHFTLNEAFGYFGTDRHFHITWLYVRVYTYPLLFITQTATIWLTVLIAASRYIAVCRPYSASKYSSLPVIQKVVAGIAVFSITYNLPRFFEVKIIPSRKRYPFAMTKFGNTVFYRLVYFDILYIIITFVLPLLVLLFLNTKLTFAYRKMQKRRRTMRMRHDHHDHSITLVMIMVVLLFIMCNAPARIVQMIWRYETHLCPSVPFFMMTLSNVLEVLNSSSNFIIYCVFRKQFRKNLKKRLCNNSAVLSHSIESTETRAVNLNGTTLSEECHQSLMNIETKSL